jgi:hypothetical protein
MKQMLSQLNREGAITAANTSGAARSNSRTTTIHATAVNQDRIHRRGVRRFQRAASRVRGLRISGRHERFTFSALKIQDDPEAIFQEGWLLCDVGAHEDGLAHLRRAVSKGYFVAPTLSGRRQFDGLRSEPAFQALLADAESGRQRALAAFRADGGERLVGR